MGRTLAQHEVEREVDELGRQDRVLRTEGVNSRAMSERRGARTVMTAPSAHILAVPPASAHHRPAERAQTATHLVSRPVFTLYVISTCITESVLRAPPHERSSAVHARRRRRKARSRSPPDAGLHPAEQQHLRDRDDQVHRRLDRQPRVQAPLRGPVSYSLLGQRARAARAEDSEGVRTANFSISKYVAIVVLGHGRSAPTHVKSAGGRGTRKGRGDSGGRSIGLLTVAPRRLARGGAEPISVLERGVARWRRH